VSAAAGVHGDIKREAGTRSRQSTTLTVAARYTHGARKSPPPES
jgi:hypothetical protein